MTIRVESELQFDEYQEIDPFDLISQGSVKLFHVECGGGAMRLELLQYESKWQFQCEACGAIKFCKPQKALVRLQQILIHGTAEEFEGLNLVGAD